MESEALKYWKRYFFIIVHCSLLLFFFIFVVVFFLWRDHPPFLTVGLLKLGLPVCEPSRREACDQAPVFQWLNSEIQRINHYVLDKHYQNLLSYPDDSELFCR